MHQRLSARKAKPETCPPEIKKFEIFFNRLPQYPFGPEYLGNYSYDIERLTREDVEFIREMQAETSPFEFCEDFAVNFGKFYRAEAIVTHFSKDDKVKYWKRPKVSEYTKKFEQRFSGRGPGSKDSIMNLYKPFVIWATEFGYEDYQISLALEKAPPTARIYRNKYGYKDFTAIRTVTHNGEGKVNRTEIEGAEGTELFDNGEVTQRGSGVKVPRAVKDTQPVGLEHDVNYASLNLELMINEISRRGLLITVTREPIINQLDIQK